MSTGILDRVSASALLLPGLYLMVNLKSANSATHLCHFIVSLNDFVSSAICCRHLCSHSRSSSCCFFMSSQYVCSDRVMWTWKASATSEIVSLIRVVLVDRGRFVTRCKMKQACVNKKCFCHVCGLLVTISSIMIKQPSFKKAEEAMTMTPIFLLLCQITCTWKRPWGTCLVSKWLT